LDLAKRLTSRNRQAAVRAMDTVTAFMNQLQGINVSEFIVAGASKRGWTTWTTGLTCFYSLTLKQN
jgi:PhoPQ-activated pathogenicity-related protein